jgi:hypothetical protein
MVKIQRAFAVSKNNQPANNQQTTSQVNEYWIEKLQAQQEQQAKCTYLGRCSSRHITQHDSSSLLTWSSTDLCLGVIQLQRVRLFKCRRDQWHISRKRLHFVEACNDLQWHVAVAIHL